MEAKKKLIETIFKYQFEFFLIFVVPISINNTTQVNLILFSGASTQNFEKQSILFSTGGTSRSAPVVFVAIFAAFNFV
jgi:hypothetical protein